MICQRIETLWCRVCVCVRVCFRSHHRNYLFINYLSHWPNGCVLSVTATTEINWNSLMRMTRKVTKINIINWNLCWPLFISIWIEKPAESTPERGITSQPVSSEFDYETFQFELCNNPFSKIPTNYTNWERINEC